jgi:hypothetical protein
VKIKERGIDVDKLDRGGFSTKFFGASGVNHFVLDDICLSPFPAVSRALIQGKLLSSTPLPTSSNSHRTLPIVYASDAYFLDKQCLLPSSQARLLHPLRT